MDARPAGNPIQQGRTMQEGIYHNASKDRLFDAVVVGGGQAGLAIAWHLKREGLRFVVLEAGSELRSACWNSLKLFTLHRGLSVALKCHQAHLGVRVANVRPPSPDTNTALPGSAH
jgi:cation diffusion facilitator CzcD-associated flavoprotein CzcO